MKIRAILVDDEINNLDNLSHLLNNYCPEVQVLAVASSADEGREIILQFQPDLVFLDIQMPHKSGFDLLRSLAKYEFEVIFVTAYDQYGIQAVKFAAIDYLLKPINIEELQSAVARVFERKQLRARNLQLENLMLHIQQQSDDHRIALPTQKEIRFIPIKQILRCESSNNYTLFFLENKEKLIISKPIYEYEDLLKDYSFLRCHQSHLVNRRFVKSWVKEDGGYLRLEDGSRIPVSRNKKDMVRQQLGNP